MADTGRCRRRAEGPDGEGGFTIIEVLVAAFILVLGALAVFMTFASAIHGVQRSKETQQGISVAQREMERIRVEPFANIGIQGGSVTPGAPTETKLPTSRVTSGGREFNLNRRGAPLSKPIVSGDLVAVKSGVRSDDGTEVTVYRFVVCEEAACLAKRIVVDVLPTPADNQAGYQRSYYELQSTVVNPAVPTTTG
jgi:Tfp pilus assembly protein PilV